MKNYRGAPFIISLLLVACAPKMVPMDASRPIETKDGYRQGGKFISQESMINALASKPASASDAKRARTLGIITNGLAIVGGALVGFPLGQKFGGAEEPRWTAAYVGLGAIAVALPLGFWGSSSLRSAVDTHNRSFDEPESDASKKAALGKSRLQELSLPSPALGTFKRDPICYLNGGTAGEPRSGP